MAAPLLITYWAIPHPVTRQTSTLSRFIFLIILFGVGYLLYHLYGKKLKSQGPKGLIRPLVILAFVLLLLAVATGRANAIFALIGGLFVAATRYGPLLIRFYPQLRQWLGRSAGAGGNVSKVTTASLAMSLDHASGRIDGEITAGQFMGRQLSALTYDEILQFYSVCERQDREALRLLQAFIEREYPEQWQSQWQGQRESAGNEAPAGDGSMSVAEAWETLGIPPGSDKRAIITAHKKLMSKLHPDKGGSNFLASRVNQAKDRLMDELKKQGGANE